MKQFGQCPESAASFIVHTKCSLLVVGKLLEYCTLNKEDR